jgi:hypothetical protein
MNVKTKVVTLIIASILILPAIFNTRQEKGEVLGVSEDTTTAIPVDSGDNPTPPVPTQQATTSSPLPAASPTQNETVEKPKEKTGFKLRNPFGGIFDDSNEVVEEAQSKQVRIKNISSGIRDTNNDDSNQSAIQTPSPKSGKVKWEAGTKASVTSDKFPVGSGIKVFYGDNAVDLVVNKSRVLVPGTVLVVDQDTFVQLGGNPETQSTINVEIVAN